MSYRSLLRPLAMPVLGRFPWLRRQVMTNCDYSVLSEAEARGLTASGWMSNVTALRQERAHRRLLAEMRRGRPRVDLRAAAEAVAAVGLSRAHLLEVGCGNGYYSEVFAYLLGNSVQYSGIDYSPVMVARARRLYPNRDFHVGNATQLDYPDRSIEIVFNGASLLHILDFERAIAESRRVARAACIFHTVPLFRERATTYLSKYAYGGSVVEIIFNRQTLLGCFSRNGLAVSKSWTSIPYDISHITGEQSFTETFLCRME